MTSSTRGSIGVVDWLSRNELRPSTASPLILKAVTTEPFFALTSNHLLPSVSFDCLTRCKRIAECLRSLETANDFIPPYAAVVDKISVAAAEPAENKNNLFTQVSRAVPWLRSPLRQCRPSARRLAILLLPIESDKPSIEVTVV